MVASSDEEGVEEDDAEGAVELAWCVDVPTLLHCSMCFILRSCRGHHTSPNFQKKIDQ